MNKKLLIVLMLGVFLVAGLAMTSAYGYTDTYYKSTSYNGYGGKQVEIVRDTPYRTHTSTTTYRGFGYGGYGSYGSYGGYGQGYSAYRNGYHPSNYYSSYNRVGNYFSGSYYNLGSKGASYNYYPRYTRSYSYPSSNYDYGYPYRLSYRY